MKRDIKALCIVAHPDDETIWMGGTILINNSWDWLILSLCRKNDLDREPKFRKVCSYYKADCIIGDLDDEILNPLDIKEIEKIIINHLKTYDFNYIFTHGENGEYGHIRHKETHLAVKNLIGKKQLLSDNVRYFSYSGDLPTANNSEFQINLPEKIHNEKLMIISEIYGFNKESFEYICSGKKEAFVK